MNFPKITLKTKFPSQMLSQSPREGRPEDSPPFWRPLAEMDFFIFTNCISRYHISDLWTGIFSVGSHEIDQCNLSLPLFHTFSANTKTNTNTKTMTITNTKTKTKTKTKRLKAALLTVPRPKTHSFSESSFQELFKNGNVIQIQRQ